MSRRTMCHLILVHTVLLWCHMQQFLAQLSYSAFSTRVWMHRSLIVLFYKNYHSDKSAYIQFCTSKYAIYRENIYICILLLMFQPEYVYTCSKKMCQYIISRTLPNLSYCWIRLWEANIHYRPSICPNRIRVENALKTHVIRISFPTRISKIQSKPTYATRWTTVQRIYLLTNQ